jgi:hypothetical protein
VLPRLVSTLDLICDQMADWIIYLFQL